MNDYDPIIESALEEALGGKTPPDFIAQTLARAGAEAAASAPPVQPLARPRSVWRAWGPGLAAAAVLVVLIGLFAVTGPQLTLSRAPESDMTAKQVEQYSEGNRAAANGSDGGSVFGSDGFDLHITTRIPRDVIKDKFSKDVPDQISGTTDLGRQKYGPPTPAKPPENMYFDNNGSNPFVDTEDDRLSTFGLEHDTGSYSIVRGYLNGGNYPPKAAVRVEEFVNYFDYDYIKPTLDPFNITMDAAPSRYGADLANCYLLRVGVQAREIPAANRKPAVLTFVIDVSGSMSGDERLGLVKRALEMLVAELVEGDRVGIAIFGSRGSVYMEHRDAGSKDAILTAIQKLQTEGGTNAEEGLKVGYEMASKAYREGCTNRVILCSDGVANVGRTQVEGILNTIVENRRKGITLSTVGFGMSNYNDTLMEQLGDKGDGHYAYVDSIDEAKRIFVDNLTGALEVVGRDVKIQIEFNPEVVKSYRLIGYVNRDIKDEDFRNDSVDGGEIGANHAATALYEIKLIEGATGAIGYATIRYKTDELDAEFTEIAQEVYTRDIASSWEAANDGLRLAGNVAEFAEILGEGFYAKNGSLEAVLADLESLRSRDEQVIELIELVKKAMELKK
jgi:Ca-activated chloride channel family protein